MSAKLVPLAFGTWTNTSVIGPAVINNVVAVKPTVELISRHIIIFISKNLDSAGCFGPTVADAAHRLSVTAGIDYEGEEKCQSSHSRHENCAKYLTSCSVLKVQVLNYYVYWLGLCQPGLEGSSV